VGVPTAVPDASSSEPPSFPWKKVGLLINEGARRGLGCLEEVLSCLERVGIQPYDSALVKGDALQGHIRRYLDDGADLILVGGGDGTLRTAAETLHGSAATLGILPLGTGNNFARDLGLPLGLPEVCKVIAQGPSRVVDLGEVEHADGSRRIFINAAHIGLFGLVNPNTEDRLKRIYGYFAYVYGAWGVSQEFTPFRLRLSSGETQKHWTVIQASAIMGRNYAGGVGQIPGETLDDHRMTLTVIERDPLLKILGTVLRIRTSRRAAPANAHRYPLAEFHLDADPPQELNIDGELMGSTPVTFRVLPHALRVVAEEPTPYVTSSWKKWTLAGGVALTLVAGAVLLRQNRSCRGKSQAHELER
jgi:YegS/Rv2252/BmrU family lipid kinase